MTLSPTYCSACGAPTRTGLAYCNYCKKSVAGEVSPDHANTIRTSDASKMFQIVPSIEVSTNTNTQRTSYTLRPEKQAISIGRAPSNDIIIDEMVVSGFHVQIRRDGGKLVFIHPHPLQPQYKTTNGLLFQGKHYPGDQPFTHVLNDGDVFRIGNQYGTLVTLTYHDGSSTVPYPVPDITPIPLGTPLISIGRNPSNTVVLNHPQVSSEHARLESSAHTYRIVDQNSTNHVYVNGQRVTNCLLKPQDLIQIGPYELIFTGTQLIQRSSSRSIRIDAINVTQYGDKQKILLNDISLTIPEGHTIILVTHATNNLNNCDYVCFMAPGGYLAYFGRPDEATTYFNLPDFADIYNALEPTDTDPDIPKKAEARFKQSPQYQQYVVQPRSQMSSSPQTGTRQSKPPQGDPWKQFGLLTVRYLELLKNDHTNLLVLLLQAPIVAVVLMLLIQFLLQPTVFTAKILPITAEQVLFIMSFVAVLLGCNNSAREIVKEIQIYRRERMVNLDIVPYLFSKVLVLGVLCLLQCFILVVAVNVISPFPKAVLLPPPLEIYVSLSLTSLVGLMMGLMISSLATNSDQANSIIPVLLIFQILFSGVIFHLTGFGEVFGGLFAMRWSMIGMGSSVGLTAFPMGYSPNDTSFPYAHDAWHVLGAWSALLVMLAIFGALTIYFLKRKDRLGR